MGGLPDPTPFHKERHVSFSIVSVRVIKLCTIHAYDSFFQIVGFELSEHFKHVSLHKEVMGLHCMYTRLNS